MKLFLHIGTEKTGTTSAQEWAANNRDLLVKQGVFYSKVLGPTNHMKVYLWALPPEKNDNGFFLNGLSSVDDRRKFQAELPKLLAEEVDYARKLGCHTFLISNEHCHSHLKFEAEVAKLHSLLRPLFEAIQVLCSFRPQVDLAVSFSSTASRSFRRIGSDFFESIGPDILYYNYAALERRWASVFGSGALDFFAFRSEPDTTLALSARLGLDIEEFQPAQFLNEALDIQTIALTNALVDTSGRSSLRLNNTIRAQLDSLGCSERLQLGSDLAKRVQAKFLLSNTDFVNRCPSISLEDLSPDWKRYEVEQNVSMLDLPCPFSEKLIEMMRLQDMHLTLAKISQRVTEGERAIALRNIVNAEKFCQRAEFLFQRLSGKPSANWEIIAKRILQLRKTIERKAKS